MGKDYVALRHQRDGEKDLRIAELESWIKDVLPDMRRSHDRGYGYFSTSQIELGERLMKKR